MFQIIIIINHPIIKMMLIFLLFHLILFIIKYKKKTIEKKPKKVYKIKKVEYSINGNRPVLDDYIILICYILVFMCQRIIYRKIP